MYLSRIQLSESIAEYSQLGKLLQSNNYGMHRLLWDLFESNEHGRFLFREENSAEQLSTRRSLPLYYVLSTTPPRQQSPLFDIQIKSFAPVLQAGETLGFKLRANPTVARRVPGAKNSRRHDVIMDAKRQFLHAACSQRQLPLSGSKGDLKAALLAHPDYVGKAGGNRLENELKEAIATADCQWLADRAGKHGFALNALQATGYRWNALPEKGRNAGFSSLDYEGLLTVTDPERLVQALKCGIGPAKAFGCGLMLIRRADLSSADA